MKTTKLQEAGERTQDIEKYGYAWKKAVENYDSCDTFENFVAIKKAEEADERTQHTQGPWKTNENAAGDIWIQAGVGFIAEITPVYGDVPESLSDQRRANARLIASSPELLEALRKMVIAFNHPREIERREAMEQAREAIKKATK